VALFEPNLFLFSAGCPGREGIVKAKALVPELKHIDLDLDLDVDLDVSELGPKVLKFVCLDDDPAEELLANRYAAIARNEGEL
jgi:hypothetical protein